jgi:hypothetical protein
LQYEQAWSLVAFQIASARSFCLDEHWLGGKLLPGLNQQSPLNNDRVSSAPVRSDANLRASTLANYLTKAEFQDFLENKRSQ